MAVLVGFIIFFSIVALTLILGAFGRSQAEQRRQLTERDIAEGRGHDVTVNPRPDDAFLRSPDDRPPHLPA